MGWYRIIWDNIYIYTHVHIHEHMKHISSVGRARPGPSPRKRYASYVNVYICTYVYILYYSILSYTIPHKFILSCIFLYFLDFPRNSVPLRSIGKSVPVHSVPFLEIMCSNPQKSVRAPKNI